MLLGTGKGEGGSCKIPAESDKTGQECNALPGENPLPSDRSRTFGIGFCPVKIKLLGNFTPFFRQVNSYFPEQFFKVVPLLRTRPSNFRRKRPYTIDEAPESNYE